MALEGMRVAVLATDGFEQVELTVPVKRLRRLGAQVEILSLRPGRIRGMNGPVPGKRVPLSISAGAAVFPQDGDGYESLLAKADSRMYHDKSLRKRDPQRQLHGAVQTAS